MVDYTINPAQSWLFQLANAFLFLSYVVPSLLGLRLLLASGTLCFMLWGWLVLPFSLDTVLWNGFFMLINLVQAAILLWKRRPVQLDADRQVLYDAFFAKGKPHHISRSDFKALTAETPFAIPQPAGAEGDREMGRSRSPSLDRRSSYAPNGTTVRVPSRLCYIQEYAAGDTVATLGGRADTLSIILRGKVVVEAPGAPALPVPVQDGKGVAPPSPSLPPSPTPAASGSSSWRPVALLREFDFIDSPEWIARRTQRRQLYSVQMRVLSAEGARLFHWNAAALDAFLAAHPDLHGVLLGVVGVDLARKVLSSNVDQLELQEELQSGGQALSAGRRFHTEGPLAPHDVQAQVARAQEAAIIAEPAQHRFDGDARTLPVPNAAGTDAADADPAAAAAAAAAPVHALHAPQQALVSLLHMARGTHDAVGPPTLHRPTPMHVTATGHAQPQAAAQAIPLRVWPQAQAAVHVSLAEASPTVSLPMAISAATEAPPMSDSPVPDIRVHFETSEHEDT